MKVNRYLVGLTVATSVLTLSTLVSVSAVSASEAQQMGEQQLKSATQTARKCIIYNGVPICWL
jgi:hypothetical protein